MSSGIALWTVSPRCLEIRAEELPYTGPDDIRVRTSVSAISHGTEMLVYRGQVSPQMALDLPDLQGSFALPIKYGYANVGRVVEVGVEVRCVAPGDVIFALHPHQTEYVIPASRAFKLPSDIEPEDAVFLANMETALNAHLDRPVRLGENVVVFGQGVVGLLVAYLACRSGAGQVFTVDSFPRRRQKSLALGADQSLEPEQAVEIVRSLTHGQGADAVFEVSGSPKALQQAIDCCAAEGTIIACSWYGTKQVALDLGGNFHRGRLKIISSQVGHINPCLASQWDYQRRKETALSLISQVKPSSLITHRVPFLEAAEAYRLIDERPGETIQVTLSYGG